MKKLTLILVCTLGGVANSFGQQAEKKEGLPYDQIFAYGMDANVKSALELLQAQSDLTGEDREFKERFLDRFSGDSDNEKYEKSGDEKIDEMLSMFRNYWRISLLDPSENYMMTLGRNVMPFLMKNYPPFKSPQQRDSLGNHLADYIKSKGFYTTKQINPQGRLVDLLIWQTQTDSTFKVRLSKKEQMEVNVVFMEDFLTLGWMEYATLGEHHPGGWTTEDALFCVKKSYDLASENFKISYLAHEARHFADKKIFNDLSDKDLEYRSKLTEISLSSKKRMYTLLEFFIENANAESVNGHQLANHQLIADLSNDLLGLDYQSNLNEWKKVSVKKLNKAAENLLVEHTDKLYEMKQD